MADRILRTEHLRVRRSEVGPAGAVTPLAFLNWTRDLANVHADELEVGLEHLMARGLSWVVARQRLSLDRPVLIDEQLTLETWPAGIDQRIFALRDFYLRDAAGTIIGRSSLQCALISWETRKALMPDQVLGERLRMDSERAYAEPFIRLKALAEATLPERRFDTRWQDTDFNLHVTSSTYLTWAVESVPVDILERSSIAFYEVHHHAETDHPTAVISRAGAINDPAEAAPVLVAGAEHTYRHSLLREADNKELARIETRWRACPRKVMVSSSSLGGISS